MTTTQHNNLWSILTPTQRDACRDMYESCGDGNVEYILEELFSKENLTSDTEPAEMLMVERSKVLLLYGEIMSTLEIDLPTEDRDFYLAKQAMIREIFGDKCLPDNPADEDNFASKPSEKPTPKFAVGDKVMCNIWETPCIVEDFNSKTNRYQVCTIKGGTTLFRDESDLEDGLEAWYKNNYAQYGLPLFYRR